MNSNGELATVANRSFEILQLLFSAILGFVGALLLERYRKREKTVVSLAEYLESIAAALEGMSIGIEKLSPSYAHSHLFKHMVLNLESNMLQLLDDEMLSRLRTLDAQYYKFIEIIAYNKRAMKNRMDADWIVGARKAAGNLRARAQLLRVKRPT